jgi:hypothetical protein
MGSIYLPIWVHFIYLLFDHCFMILLLKSFHTTMDKSSSSLGVNRGGTIGGLIFPGWICCERESTVGEPVPTLLPLRKSQNPFKLFLNITNVPCVDAKPCLIFQNTECICRTFIEHNKLLSITKCSFLKHLWLFLFFWNAQRVPVGYLLGIMRKIKYKKTSGELCNGLESMCSWNNGPSVSKLEGLLFRECPQP